MAGITLEIAQDLLDRHVEALKVVLVNQEYTMPGGRRFTKADIAEIEAGIDKWEVRVQRLTNGGGITVRGVTPL